MPDVVTAEHPTGLKIYFSEEDHKYIDERKTEYKSTTRIVHSLFPEFQKNMIAGFCAKSRGVSKDVILEEWQATADKACDMGTRIHRYAECKLLGIDVDVEILPDEQQRVNHLDKFLVSLDKYYELVETEKIIFSPSLKLSGTVDLIMQDKRTKQKAIFDWKTNKEIKKKDKYNKWGKMFLSHIPNCNFAHYSIQLGIYNKMLNDEKYGDYTNCALGLFHINNDGVEGHKITYMENELNQVFEYISKLRGYI